MNHNTSANFTNDYLKILHELHREKAFICRARRIRTRGYKIEKDGPSAEACAWEMAYRLDAARDLIGRARA